MHAKTIIPHFGLLLLSTFAPALAGAGDTISKATLTGQHFLVVEVETDGKALTRSFKFPAPIAQFKAIVFVPGQSVLVAAKPSDGPDWFWGIAYLGDTAPQQGSVTKWGKSPPADASLLALERPGGDSFVIYAARFKRGGPVANEITTYAYVNHCPLPGLERDPIGSFYSGDIGGPENFDGIKVEPGAAADTEKPTP